MYQWKTMEKRLPGKALIRAQLREAKRKTPGGFSEGGAYSSKFSTCARHSLKTSYIPYVLQTHEDTPNSLSLLLREALRCRILKTRDH